MQALNQVFSMYNRPKSDTSQSDAYAQRYFEQKRKEEEAKRLQEQREKQGQLLGDIARKKLGIDTDFMAINDDPAMNTKMYDPSLFDYDMDELAPNDFELAVMQDEANNDQMDTMDYYSPEELQNMETANLYQQMATAGYGDQALDLMFPKSKGTSLAEKQFAMQNMAKIDADMDQIGRQYSQALISGDNETAKELYDKASKLYREYGQYAFGVNQKPRSWKYFEEKPVDTDALAEQRSQEAINEAQIKLNNGEITQDEYNQIYYSQKAKAKGVKGDVVNTGSEIQKEAQNNAKFKLQLSEAEDKIFTDGITNLKSFKVNESIDAYNRYLPILKASYEDAKKGKAGSQRAIVVAFNKLIEPSSAVMEGDFRSSGANALASAGQQLGDVTSSVLNGDFDGIGRKLSSDEIEAIYNASLKIADAMRNSASSRIQAEEKLIQGKMKRAGFNYRPNMFVNYIGLSSPSQAKVKKPNPANYTNLGAFRNAGGDAKDWFAYMKKIKG